MIGMRLYFEPINDSVKGYSGLYRGSFNVDHMKNTNNLINAFFKTSADGQNLAYNEENREKIIELYQSLKREKWDGDLICFTDDKRVEIPGFTMVGYDVCADSMYYSPVGDGFLTQYNRYPDFYTDMSLETYSIYRDNLNEKWLFNSYEMAMKFSEYCNHINKKNLHCIESQDNWRPVAIHIYGRHKTNDVSVP